MPQTTSHEAFQPYTAGHESDLEYEQSIEDFSVPEPVAEVTGVEDLSEFNGFEHRGETFMASVAISDIRHALYFEHSHSGDDPTPQTTITAHAAIDRTLSQLSKLFETWFKPDPDECDKETSGHYADADKMYSALLMDDPLNLRDQPTDIHYAREAHRQIIASALSMLLSTVSGHAEADESVRKQTARQELRQTLAFDVHDDLPRADAVRLVNETYDRLDDDE